MQVGALDDHLLPVMAIREPVQRWAQRRRANANSLKPDQDSLLQQMLPQARQLKTFIALKPQRARNAGSMARNHRKRKPEREPVVAPPVDTRFTGQHLTASPCLATSQLTCRQHGAQPPQAQAGVGACGGPACGKAASQVSS